MLGYRSLFHVDRARRGITAEVLAQAHSWLRSKNYDADALAVNDDVALVAPHAQAVITAESGQDGSTSTLFTLREDHTVNGTWITQVVVHEPGADRADPWVWIDVEKEGDDEVWAARPRLAEMILGVLPGDDHGARLTATPTLVDAGGVDQLVDVLTSQQRRGPVFVAGSSEDLPIEKWTAYVSQILRETVGLSAGYVLDGDATARLVRLVGARQAVQPGTLRTYLPGVDPSSELDPFRHRYLTTETILRTRARDIQRSLGRRARDLALTTPVPRWATRVESRLLTATDARVLGWRPTAIVEEEPVPPAPPKYASAPEAASVDVVPQALAHDRAIGGTLPPAELVSLARELFGAELDANLLRQLADDRREAISLSGELLNATTRARALNDRVLFLERQLEEARAESQDAQLEWAMAESELTERERVIHNLRLRLMESGEGESAWRPIAEPSGLEIAPDSFAELLVRIDELRFVTFTGDPDPCYALDEKMPVGAAAKAWSALLALDDYARGKESGDVNVGVHLYLSQTPPGYLGFSANRHAATESESVQNNPKLASQRYFAVPEDVVAGGRTFMGAHFKIAQFATVSPRLHYYDATPVDGRVYVGYIGAHLPTQMST